ncbi:Ribosomal lysine N-methyltransferase 4 [Tilletia horrida]|nr:Ribosomal lysine N-methyltransferase 4 [Tilletia horrida]
MDIDEREPSASTPETTTTTTTPGQKLANLEKWCKQNDIELHEVLRPALSDHAIPAIPPHAEVDTSTTTPFLHHGVHLRVRNFQGSHYPYRRFPDALAVSIPRKAVLTPETSSLAEHDNSFTPRAYSPQDQDDAGLLASGTPPLALCLLHEFLLGPRSRFWPFLDTLPPYGVELPRVWAEESPEYELIRGTELEHDLRQSRHASHANPSAPPDHGATDQFLRKYFEEQGLSHLSKAHPHLVQPDAPDHSTSSALREDSGSKDPPVCLHVLHRISTLTCTHLWVAYDMCASIVTTSSIIIDALQTLALVPFLDNSRTSFSASVYLEQTKAGTARAGKAKWPSDAYINLRFEGLTMSGRKVQLAATNDHLLPRSTPRRVYDDLQEKNIFWALPSLNSPEGADAATSLGQPSASLFAAAEEALKVIRDDNNAQLLYPAPKLPHFPRMHPESSIGAQCEEQDFISLWEVDYSTSDRDERRDDGLIGFRTRPLFVEARSGFVSDRLWIIALAMAVQEAEPEKEITAHHLLLANSRWWHPDRMGTFSKWEAAGFAAVKKIRHLVKTRLARMADVIGDDVLAGFIESNHVSLAVKNGALRNRGERKTLRRCLSELDRLCSVPERRAALKLYGPLYTAPPK